MLQTGNKIGMPQLLAGKLGHVDFSYAPFWGIGDAAIDIIITNERHYDQTYIDEIQSRQATWLTRVLFTTKAILIITETRNPLTVSLNFLFTSTITEIYQSISIIRACQGTPKVRAAVGLKPGIMIITLASIITNILSAILGVRLVVHSSTLSETIAIIIGILILQVINYLL